MHPRRAPRGPGSVKNRFHDFQPKRSFGRPFRGDTIFPLPERPPRGPQEASGVSKTDSSCRSSWGCDIFQPKRSFGSQNRRPQIGHFQCGNAGVEMPGRAGSGRAGPGRAGSRRKRESATEPLPNAPRKKIRRSGTPLTPISGGSEREARQVGAKQGNV